MLRICFVLLLWLAFPTLAEVSLLGESEQLDEDHTLVEPIEGPYVIEGAYQPVYPLLLKALYPRDSTEPLWFDHHNAANLRQHLRWLVLEQYLATGHLVFKQWWDLLNEPSYTQRLQEQMYSDAFLALLGVDQYLSRLDYQQMMSLQELKDLSPPTLDTTFLKQLRPDFVRYLLQQWGSAENPHQEQYHYWLAYWYELAENEYWPQLRYHGLIRPGESSAQLPFIRRQLGFINPEWKLKTNNLSEFDVDFQALIRRFQRQHGLVDDAIIGRETLAWLNFSPLLRAQRLARNALRQRLFSAQLNHDQNNWFVVNLPDYKLTYYQHGQAFLQSRVVIGRRSRKTPLLVGDISQVVLNPYWNVPRSILRKDLLSKFIDQPDYIQQHRYEVINYQNQLIDPNELDWQQIAQSRQFPYRVRQRPGTGNALGRYKFHFVNDYAVYLHDTSAPELFEQTSRSYSSGCVRVEQAALLAQQLLDGAGVSRERQSRWLLSNKPKWIGLPQTVPVYLVYFSSWFDAAGYPQFRKDVYQYDNVDITIEPISNAIVKSKN